VNKYQSGGEQESIQISLFWGISGIDKDGSSLWDSEEYGSAIFDPDFDMSSTANQQRLYDICISLGTNPLVLGGATNVDCWIEDFRDHVTAGSFPSASFDADLTSFLATSIGQGHR